MFRLLTKWPVLLRKLDVPCCLRLLKQILPAGYKGGTVKLNKGAEESSKMYYLPITNIPDVNAKLNLVLHRKHHYILGGFIIC